MAQARKWTECEFTTLLYRPELGHEALAEILAEVREERTAGAVGVVREGVHVWHEKKRNAGGILAKMMIDLLEDKNRLALNVGNAKKDFSANYLEAEMKRTLLPLYEPARRI